MRKGRWVVVVTVVLLVTGLLAAGPATAKKPPQPTQLETVTLSFVDGFDGLDAVLEMQADTDRSGAVQYLADGNEGSSPADMYVRGFADFLSQGFHPGVRLVDPDDCGLGALYEGMTWISFDRNGVLDSVLWHFDMHVGRNASQRGKKARCDWRVYERYTLRSLADNELPPGEPGLSFVDGVVSGTFKLHLYDTSAAEPHVDLARTFMQFELTIGG